MEDLGDTPLCRGIYGDSEVKLTSRQEVKRISAVLWKGGKVGDKTSARVLYWPSHSSKLTYQKRQKTIEKNMTKTNKKKTQPKLEI